MAPLLPTLACWALLAVGLGVTQEVGALKVKMAEDRYRRTDKPHCFLVKMKEGATTEHRDTVFDQMHGDEGQKWQHTYHGFSKCNARVDQLEQLAAHPWVEYIEEDGVVNATSVETLSADLWNLDRIDQRQVALDGTFNYQYTGTGVFIYVVDTGVQATHQEFGGRVTEGKDFVGRKKANEDCNGHGTHVAGTAAGSSVGVAKNATIVPLRVLNCRGSGSNSDIISGLDWVATQPKPGVVTMSLGGSLTKSLNSAVEKLVEKGYHVTVAAGNEASDACNTSPAAVASAITVGSTDSRDVMSSFSNFGSCVDIFAPGSNIYSASNEDNTGYTVKSGTSMATPLVAGTVAAYLGTNTSVTPAEMATFLKSVATSGVLNLTDTASPNLLLYSNAGRVAATATSLSAESSEATIVSPEPKPSKLARAFQVASLPDSATALPRTAPQQAGVAKAIAVAGWNSAPRQYEAASQSQNAAPFVPQSTGATVPLALLLAPLLVVAIVAVVAVERRLRPAAYHEDSVLRIWVPLEPAVAADLVV